MSLRRIMLSICLLASTSVAHGQPAAIPPAQLAMGRTIAAKMVPDGTYQKMMSGSMSQMLTSVNQQMTAMPLAPFLQAGGLTEQDVERIGTTTMKEVLEIVDPAHDQRMQIMMPAMMKELGTLMTRFEPDMREGLAEAYASRFTPAQMSDIVAFLNTDSGRAFAAQNLEISSDPAVMKRVQAFIPTMIQSMPAIIQKAAAAVQDLPKPKTPQTLTDADRARLAELLGVEASKFRPGPSS